MKDVAGQTTEDENVYDDEDGLNQTSKNAPNNALADRYYANYQATFDAAWELDVWGKFRRAVQNGVGNLESSIANYDDILVSLTAEVASTYVNLRIAEERLAVAYENVEIQKRSLNRTEFRVGTIALLGVLTFGILQGVLIGLVLSLLVLIARSSGPNIPELGRSTGSDVFHCLTENPDSETYPGLAIIRFDGPLYFATANALCDRVREVTTDVTPPPMTMVLIDMEAVNYLDLESCDMLNKIIENIKSIGVEIHLARVKHGVMEMLHENGVDQIIGHDHIHNKVIEAAQWFTHKEKHIAENDQTLSQTRKGERGDCVYHQCSGVRIRHFLTPETTNETS